MKWTTRLVVIVAITGITSSAPAALFKKAPPKGDPVQRVPQLLYTVKMEPDEKKRAAAANELREYDSKMFPEIVPILADVVHNDKSSAVRLEAVQSLSKIRPVSAIAGEALEHAAKDSVLRIRVQAWTNLRLYQLAGYRSGAKEPKEFKIEVVNDAQNRPVAAEAATKPAAAKLGLLRAGVAKTNAPQPATPSTDIPRPLPTAPGFSTAIPNAPPRVTPPPIKMEPPGAEPPR